ncbi:MAG TPA: O-antigen ligase family protein [Gaiellaceae bacterium]|jgi:O-antigen ligase|nr:O-antigen ligase family protein [Gaiellaceae bacterium]
MTLELLARVGAVAAAGGLAALVVARPSRLRLGGLGLWAAGLALMVPLLVPDGQARVLAAGALLFVVMAPALAFLFRRVPWALPFLGLAAVPARVPVDVGDETANLLVPLYLVVAGAALELGWSLWRDEARSRELGRAAWPLAAYVAWVGLSATWAGDATEAAVVLFFFIFPFGLLALAIARLPWRERPPVWLFRLLVAMAFLFAAVGIAQWATKEVFWNEKVMRGNENSVLFRVNSLFWDPSMYGRFLVVAILAILVVLVGTWARERLLPLVAVVLVLWVGLLFSFSQSSFMALSVGLAVVALLAWGRRAALALAALLVVSILTLLFAPPLESVRQKLTDGSSESLNKATRGRSDLILNGLKIAAEHPIVGVGIGNFTSAYEERFKTAGRGRAPASHTTPVTVAAETGIVGLGLFSWFLAAVFALGFGVRRVSAETLRLTGLVAFVGIAAILVHSLFYSAFLEDPMTWGLVGLAALCASTAAALRKA